MAPILSSVAVCRVRFIRSVNNLALATKGLIATPSVSRLTVPGEHGFIDLEPVKSQIGQNGVGYFDLVATDDAQVNETFGWTITGDGWPGFVRVVAVPQTGSTVETITLTDGSQMPAVWLNQLADFTGSSGSTGPDAATRTYVDDALDIHEAASDPHPQYALDSDVTGLAALKQWAANPDALIVGTVTRDVNGAATSAGVVWPDGVAGTYTATTLSSSFPGAVDAYTITRGSPATATYTQPAVTRNASGAVTQRPAIAVS